MTESDGTLSALGKEANAGDDVVFKDIATEFPCIYNRGSAQFKNRNLSINAWRKIGKLAKTIDNVEMENERNYNHTQQPQSSVMRTLGHWFYAT